VPRTLADLTLELSQAIAELEARCASEMVAAERERDEALLAMAPARKVLSQYHKGLEKAKQSQLDSVSKADDARRKEIGAAEEKRRKDMARQERKYRDARNKAEGKRAESIRKARGKWRDAVEKAKRQKLTDQRRLRRAADDALEKAYVEASDTYNLAIETARLTHQAALQDILVDERLAVEKAHRKAERLITGAAIAYERAVAHEEAKMRTELGAFADAREAQEAYDQRLAEIRERCESEKDELFRDFSRKRRKLKR
jgi:hypothetical protein